jgi:hypothetical protein
MTEAYRSAQVFWLVMTVVTFASSVIYAVLGGWGGRLGIGSARLQTIKRSSWGLFAWAAICAGHYALILH